MKILLALGIVATGVVALYLFRVAVKLLLGNPAEYERNRLRSGGFKGAMRGQVPTALNGTRDYRVAAGLAVETDSGTWIEQGRLSDEAILASLRRSRA